MASEGSALLGAPSGNGGRRKTRARRCLGGPTRSGGGAEPGAERHLTIVKLDAGDAYGVAFADAERAEFLVDAHLRENLLEARERFVRIEVGHLREPLDALA